MARSNWQPGQPLPGYDTWLTSNLPEDAPTCPICDGAVEEEWDPDGSALVCLEEDCGAVLYRSGLRRVRYG